MNGEVRFHRILNQRMYSLRSLFLMIPVNFSSTSVLLIRIFEFAPMVSGISNKISLSSLLMIVCKRRAPMFSISSLIAKAFSAISSSASLLNSMETFSASINAMYCLVRAFFGSFKIFKNLFW